MKKMRRLFSLLMVLSLALGVLSVTAFAEDNQVWLTDGTYSGGNDNSSGETVFNTHEWNPPYSGNYNGATITISNYTADGIEANTYAQITTDKDIYVGSIVVKASDGYITYTVPDGILYAGKTYIAKSVTHAQSGAGGKGTKIHDISHVIIHDIGGLVPTAPSTPTDTGDTTTPATPTDTGDTTTPTTPTDTGDTTTPTTPTDTGDTTTPTTPTDTGDTTTPATPTDTGDTTTPTTPTDTGDTTTPTTPTDTGDTTTPTTPADTGDTTTPTTPTDTGDTTTPATPTDTGDTTTPATPAASTTPTTPVTDITTPEVPLAELPVTGTTTTVPEQPETTEDIQEPPVALASTPPATGDMGLVWFLLASVSAAGVIVLRKKETAGEQ